MLLRQAKIKTVHQHKTNPEINVRGSSLNRKEVPICKKGEIPLVNIVANYGSKPNAHQWIKKQCCI